jgi:predicted transcriptional regulator
MPRCEAAIIELAISYAVNHPIRLDCLAILIVRTASPKEIARELGIGVSTAAHHVAELHKDGVVELVKTESGGQRRGGSESYYRATALPEVTDEDWLVMPRDCRRQMAGRVLHVSTDRKRPASRARCASLPLWASTAPIPAIGLAV